MPAYFKLCRYLFTRYRIAIWLAAGALAVLDLLSILLLAGNADYAYATYDAVLEDAQWMRFFLLTLLLLCCHLWFRVLQDTYLLSRPIYTLMTLPCPFWVLPLVWATLFLSAVCLLSAVQLALTGMLYPLFQLLSQTAVSRYVSVLAQQLHMPPEHLNFPVPGVRKGLYYAVLNSRFLRILLPLSPTEWPLWLARLLFPSASATALLCSRRIFAVLSVTLCSGICLLVISVSLPLGVLSRAGIALIAEAVLFAQAFHSIHRRRNLP